MSLGRRTLRFWALTVGGAAALLLVGSLALAMTRGVGNDPYGTVDAGFDVASDFTLVDFEGGQFVLSDYSDGPLFLYFWASWCRSCQRDAPVIERAWADYQLAGYTFVGINILDEEKDAREFVRKYGLTFPNVFDTDGTVYVEYGVYGIPEAFFLRPGMLVNEKYLGEFSESQFRGKLDALLAGVPGE